MFLPHINVSLPLSLSLSFVPSLKAISMSSGKDKKIDKIQFYFSLDGWITIGILLPSLWFYSFYEFPNFYVLFNQFLKSQPK